MGNMEPRRLHEREEKMGENRGGIQEVLSCPLPLQGNSHSSVWPVTFSGYLTRS